MSRDKIDVNDFIDSKNDTKQKNKNETIDDILNNIEESDII